MPPAVNKLDLLALVGIARLADDAYGVAIHEEIERVSGRHVSLAGVYAALDRLEGQGLLRTYQSEPRAERGGRSRRHFVLSAKGRELVRRERELAARMWDGLSTAAPERQR